MRFTTAWAETSKQNITLQIFLIVSSILSLTFAITTVKLSLKDPLIFERGCVTKSLTPSSTERSKTEIESFVREALHQRFDTDAMVQGDFLASDEVASRTIEQKDLVQKNVKQRVLLNSIKINGNQIDIDSDRVISVEQIRSALSMSLTLLISTTQRTEANSYGLEASKISLASKSQEKSR